MEPGLTGIPGDREGDRRRVPLIKIDKWRTIGHSMMGRHPLNGAAVA